MMVTRPLLLEIARDIWASMLRMDLQESDPAEFLEAGGDQYFVGAVQIVGQRELLVTLRLSRALAQQVTAAMLELEPIDITEVLTRDAVGELANLVAGTLQNKMPGRNRLSSPTVILGESSALVPPNTSKLFDLSLESFSQARKQPPTVISVHERRLT